MTPFELRIRLLTPMEVGRFSVRLDGLLWHALYLHLGCPIAAQEALGDYLEPVENAAGQRYYKASSMVFGLVGKINTGKKEVVESLLALTRAKVGVMRDGSDLSPEKFKPNSANGKRYTRVITFGGVYKNRLDKNPAYFASHVVFHGVGKGQEIAELIEFYVGAIGINSNSGSGTIGEVTAFTTHKDYSLVDQFGFPARPLPVSDYVPADGVNVAVEPCILTPPFREQEFHSCYIPERIRKIQLSSLGV